MTPTKSGHFNIVNGTRYNTAEIVALFDTMVEVYVKRGCSVEHVHPEAAMGTVLDICDYNPSSPWDTTRHWDAETNTYQSKRERSYVKRAGYALTTRFKIGLLPPEKLYDNPLEALVSAEGDERAPIMLTRRLAERLNELVTPVTTDGNLRYNWELRQGVIDEVMAVHNRGILIEKKRGEVDKADKRLREKRLAAQRCLNMAGYDLRQTLNYLINASGVTRSAMDACKEAQVAPMFDAAMFEICISYLTTVAAGMERTVNERLKV